MLGWSVLDSSNLPQTMMVDQTVEELAVPWLLSQEKKMLAGLSLVKLEPRQPQTMMVDQAVEE